MHFDLNNTSDIVKLRSDKTHKYAPRKCSLEFTDLKFRESQRYYIDVVQGRVPIEIINSYGCF
jgi:hypothetical protein